ncbi:hypothetical protein DFJ43DRAFT_1161563 [Lentinula guzmanii]|uniref:Uncharacterized protein n=3 Tax=Lentinula TaxID=5352 RepID=A0AA38MVC9_9AGAR|nr:hypothetical protein DFJ43DRAFT_1161563 [Lentinula guzmanii]KAJ3738505.1 hypothetical protein DFH05DRAFT_1464588 [Lentinula detonsa]KAJ3780063.1 hypothetical protein GGU10DRAFT_381267 [Lentinula aff. detonsa]KAJ3738572.1 hypothetical protein DFH05DRAFT_1464513 [Lentinula detonsa]KAJ3792268.1 hypothetical protein GGU11DRAFT_760897 [Lentinula aff. detonsa]
MPTTPPPHLRVMIDRGPEVEREEGTEDGCWGQRGGGVHDFGICKSPSSSPLSFDQLLPKNHKLGMIPREGELLGVSSIKIESKNYHEPAAFRVPFGHNPPSPSWVLPHQPPLRPPRNRQSAQRQGDVRAFLGDGRDTAPRSAVGLVEFMRKEEYGELATVFGRY